MFWSGFQFGMLLQLSIGPVCLFLLQCAAALGFWKALPEVCGVVLADGCYILAAVYGVGALLKRRGALRSALGRAGGLTLCGFGVLALWQAWRGAPLSTGFALQQGVFWQAALLTLSNPLTILFWTGVFAARIGEAKEGRAGVVAFSCGALCAALCFLTAVAWLGGWLRGFLSPQLLRGLNGAVGCAFLYFGWKFFLRAKC